MFDLLKEVGRGKKGAKNLTYEQACNAAERILTGKATSAQIGAFFMAERIKMESPEEILAFVEALRVHSIRYLLYGGIDCAGPYDGRRHSWIATLPTAFVLTACGLPVTLHGSPALPPKRGIALIDVLKEMGLSVRRCSREALQAGADQSGFLFVPADSWCAPLRAIRPLREELGFRTLLNTAEKLIRFSDAPYMAIGVFHKTAFDKMTEILTHIGVHSGIIVQGTEGSEDLPVDRRSRAAILRKGRCETMIFDPDSYGLKKRMPNIEWTAKRQAQTISEVLQGSGEPAYRNMVLLNSAVRLWTAGRAESPEEGLERACHTLDRGLALHQYQWWRETVLAMDEKSR
ncbi:anthranilate phosphoribosyltransferase [Paludifilum halophilum]|uniref:Anthranilate phosphoribosyltransferase n=1 Tax=Paludifilum halophilum TaxID=1642702 RepID=A0A235B4C6_9BACL|nr:hypothetical protein [Paludifilum halophilum]OYD07082.1 hypothetical protein CHM34_11800 [Paludifilum halophilum]